MYNTIADATKGAAHWVIDITFPRTATIATLTGFTSWYAYRDGMTYSQAYLIEKMTPLIHHTLDNVGISLPDIIKNTISNRIHPLYVPTLSPYISLAYSIGASCAVSCSLNLLHIGIIKTRVIWNWMLSKEQEKTNTPMPVPAAPLNVIPGYRKEIEMSTPDMKRTIEIPIHSPRSIHGIYFQKP